MLWAGRSGHGQHTSSGCQRCSRPYIRLRARARVLAVTIAWGRRCWSMPVSASPGCSSRRLSARNTRSAAPVGRGIDITLWPHIYHYIQRIQRPGISGRNGRRVGHTVTECRVPATLLATAIRSRTVTHGAFPQGLTHRPSGRARTKVPEPTTGRGRRVPLRSR